MFTGGAIAFWKNHLKVEEERPRAGQVDYLQSLKGEFVSGPGPGNSGGKLEKGQVSLRLSRDSHACNGFLF